jgi:hypothetical protein
MEIVILETRQYCSKDCNDSESDCNHHSSCSDTYAYSHDVLPAFIELKKPKDGGPRMIPMGNSEMNTFIPRFISIVNMEDDQKFDSSLIQTMAKIVDVLPSLEV